MYRYIVQVIDFYSLPSQLHVYENLLEESRTLRRHHCVYRALKPMKLGHFALALYGFRTAGQYNVFARERGDLVAFSAEYSQQRNIEYVCALSGGVMKPRHILHEQNRVARLWYMLRLALDICGPANGRALRKALRLIRHIDRKYSWVQAINAASFLFNAFSFRHAFTEENKAAFTANDFSPVPLAFKYASYARGLKQMLVMHGQLPVKTSETVMPRLDYDLSFLYGETALDTYRVKGEPLGRILFTGFPGESRAIRKAPEEIGSVGICLSNFYDEDTHKAIIKIGKLYAHAAVIIRCHPRMTRRPDFSGFGNISFSTFKAMSDFLQGCDFVIAGNTGAQVDMLKLGCPVAHFSKLDKFGDDDMGMVADRTVMGFDETRALTGKDIDQFFNDGWVKRFRRYDALYMATAEETRTVREDVARAYRELLEGR